MKLRLQNGALSRCLQPDHHHPARVKSLECLRPLRSKAALVIVLVEQLFELAQLGRAGLVCASRRHHDLRANDAYQADCA
jgi:hypothetical protein